METMALINISCKDTVTVKEIEGEADRGSTQRQTLRGCKMPVNPTAACVSCSSVFFLCVSPGCFQRVKQTGKKNYNLKSIKRILKGQPSYFAREAEFTCHMEDYVL